MNINLEELINEFSFRNNIISTERKLELDEIASIIIQHFTEFAALDIIVVCTHNSRRSQLGEVWINFLANYFNINNLKAYSGGMEVTAFNKRMVNALNDCGFNLDEVEGGINPRYVLRDIGMEDHLMYSKIYNDSMNPQSDFMAFMVCSHADENCPIVHGMKYRIPLRYKDPKEFDDTNKEQEAYSNKVKEVGVEMFYLLDKVKLSL